MSYAHTLGRSSQWRHAHAWSHISALRSESVTKYWKCNHIAPSTNLSFFLENIAYHKRGREKKGTRTYQLLPLLVLHAPSNGQPASQVRTDTTVRASRSEQWATIEKRDGTEPLWLTSNFSKFEKLSVSVQLLNCAKDNPLHKNESFKFWRSSVFWLHNFAKWFSHSVFFLSFRQGQKSYIWLVHIPRTLAKRWWEAPWSSSQFSLDVQTSNTPTHFNVVHDKTQFFPERDSNPRVQFIGPRH